MANNKLSNIGDSIIVNVRPRVNGRVSLIDYVDVLIGVTSNRSVVREFRITTDEIFNSDWELLTSDNLSAHVDIVTYEYLIQVRYTRTGTTVAGEIEFVSINFSGGFEPIEFIAPTIFSSIFKDIINKKSVYDLERNLFKKLYFRGILPKYIERGDNIDKVEDKDFIALFSTIAKFFAMMIHFFKRFDNFNNDFELMREHVRQSGLYFDESKITLLELQYLSEHIYDEIRKRGTDMIFKRSGDVLRDGSEVPIDGEFIRLLRIKTYDEFIYEVVPTEKSGWCLGVSSPNWKGTNETLKLNKTKESTQDFQSLDNFVHYQYAYGTMSLQDVIERRVAELRLQGDGMVGFGRIDESEESENLYVVDSHIDYEITFDLKMDLSNSAAKLLFGVEGFDALKNKLPDSFVSSDGHSIKELFFDQSTSYFRDDVWYHVRGIIHAYSSINTEEVPLNIGIGNNLYFNNRFVKYILPKIQIHATGIAEEDQGSELALVNIWNYKIRPLVRGNNILPLKNGAVNAKSMCFTQAPKLLYVYAKNNNNSLTQLDVSKIVDKYLLPFNVSGVFVYADKY